MAIFLVSPVESCGGGHGLLEKRGGLPFLLLRREQDDHGHLPLFHQWRVVKVAMAYAIIF